MVSVRKGKNDKMCKFSLITVCLNPGKKLRISLESALCQTFHDFELIIKDGGSNDGSLESVSDLTADPRIRIFSQSDTGIYDAMNQAVAHANGEYVFFLNCGDRLYNEQVLEKTAEAMRKSGVAGSHGVFYGKVYNKRTAAWIIPPPKITGFTCYRNVPCHQACFYALNLCKEKPFETRYKIRGDYEHFLWCWYRAGAAMQYMDLPVAEYEGGGFSETRENLKRSDDEHKQITAVYMSLGELFLYRLILVVTLAPLRRRLSESKRFAAVYNMLIGKLYRR